MDLHDDVGRIGSGARSSVTEVVIEQDYRDYLIGRLLPIRERAGTLSTFSKVLEHEALTLGDLEGIIAAAEGRLH
jgi:hypothetical protein